MINPKYREQVDLLLKALPIIATEEIFALKGGTAINLFERELHRLSVDIDLAYVGFEDRETAFENIQNGLGRIKNAFIKAIPGISISSTQMEGYDSKLNCQTADARIKIEVNMVTRGHIAPVRHMEVTNAVEEEFEKHASINVLSHAELWGGKICAALDRQHPRDLFDVKILLDEEGLTDEIKYGFLVFLMCHMRPMNEVIFPNYIDNKDAYEKQFKGMTTIPFTYKDYEDTRIRLVESIKESLTEEDKFFLLTFKMGIPSWSFFPIYDVKELTGVKWKLFNINKLKKQNPDKYLEQHSELSRKLYEK